MSDEERLTHSLIRHAVQGCTWMTPEQRESACSLLAKYAATRKRLREAEEAMSRAFLVNGGHFECRECSGRGCRLCGGNGLVLIEEVRAYFAANPGPVEDKR